MEAQHGALAVSVFTEAFDKLATNPETAHKMAAGPESFPVMSCRSRVSSRHGRQLLLSQITCM